MSKRKTKPKRPKPPKSAPPENNNYSIVPPDLIVDRSKPKVPVKPGPPVKTKTYDCLKSDKELTFYLVEVNGPASSKGAGPFVFKYAPKNVTWKKQVGISEYKTQGNTEQPLYFTAGSNKKLQLQEIIFDGHDGSHVLPHDQLNRLQVLQLPAKGTTKLRAFQLLVGNFSNKSFSARSYGKFVISSLDIAEVFRDPSTGLTLRAKVNLELTEVAAYQLDLGNDLAIPTSIVPTLPKELAVNLNTLGPTLSTAGSATEVGGAIQAGDLIAKIGGKGTRGGTGKNGEAPHLHYEFLYKGDERFKAIALYGGGAKDDGSWKTYPKEILDILTLGPWEKGKVRGKAKKLSEMKTRIPGGYLGRYRVDNKRRHPGVDYQLDTDNGGTFANEDSRGVPIYTNVPLFFVGTVQEASGAFRWEGTLNGREFYITILHIDDNGLSGTMSGTATKKSSSTRPLNPGGNTPGAIKKSGSAPNTAAYGTY